MLGCGGVSSGADALKFTGAGTSAVQMYTSSRYKGPGAAHEIKDELAALLRKEDRSWKEVVCDVVERSSWCEPPPPPRVPAPGEASVQLLTQEVEEPKRLLERLCGRMTQVTRLRRLRFLRRWSCSCWDSNLGST